ncbi:MAG: hypothetical protein QG628_605 [Patescibacteria group bacterium]|jgi:hypothetical protein|nr:hypothetical protein [Patescibacteria group bacterium]
MSKKKELSYEEIGKMLVNIYESGYINQNQTYKLSFLKGIATGVGGVIGATVVIALLLWGLSLFQEIPLIGPVVQKIQTTIDQGN